MIKAGIPILISGKDLLGYIPEEDIAFRYIVGFNKIGNFFKSEFRNEKDPSSKVFVGNQGNLMFKDFGDPNIPKALTMVGYVQHKYQLEYQEAINKIAIDFGLINGKSSSYSIVRSGKNKVKREYKIPSDLIIKIKKRDWTDRDKYYWNQYYIPIEMLERNNIKSISHVFINNYPPTEFTNNHLAFSYDYYWHKNIFRRKVYQPESRDYKWRSNVDYTIVQNYPNIPKQGKLLFIQSSYKDCMVMELLGYNAIAPNKEGSWFPLEYWNKIKERFEKIIIYWNNDYPKEPNPGLEYAKNFSKQFNLPYILNPNGEPSDISDFVKKYSLKEGKELVRNLKLNYEKA